MRWQFAFYKDVNAILHTEHAQRDPKLKKLKKENMERTCLK